MTAKLQGARSARAFSCLTSQPRVDCQSQQVSQDMACCVQKRGQHDDTLGDREVATQYRGHEEPAEARPGEDALPLAAWWELELFSAYVLALLGGYAKEQGVPQEA